MSTIRRMVLPAIFVVAVVAVVLALSRGSSHKQAPDNAMNANTQAIAWHQSLPEALAAAKQRKALIVVDTYADWCHWCKKMDEDTFANAEVQHRMKDFIPLRINTDTDQEFARRYGITGLPTTLVLDATGNVKINQSGYLPPRDYLTLLTQVAKTHTN